MIFPIVNDHDSRNPKADQIFSSAPDAERFAEVIDLLAPHIDETVLVTGGFAVEWNLLAKGGGANRRVLNDIDLAVDRRSAILPSITNHFLVHHFHPTREKGNVLMQLVEPKSKTRVDIFSARPPDLRIAARERRLGT